MVTKSGIIGDQLPSVFKYSSLLCFNVSGTGISTDYFICSFIRENFIFITDKIIFRTWQIRSCMCESIWCICWTSTYCTYDHSCCKTGHTFDVETDFLVKCFYLKTNKHIVSARAFNYLSNQNLITWKVRILKIYSESENCFTYIGMSNSNPSVYAATAWCFPIINKWESVRYNFVYITTPLAGTHVSR